jgi:hypothetical protein
VRHRHLTGIDPWSPAAVDDILDRGRPKDWVALRQQIDREPWGAVAETTLRLCAATHRYGTSALWSAYVDRLRAQHPAHNA